MVRGDRTDATGPGRGSGIVTDGRAQFKPKNRSSDGKHTPFFRILQIFRAFH